MTDERGYWAAVIADLRSRGYTLQGIADLIGVDVRQACNWSHGARPKGMHAVNLYAMRSDLFRRSELHFLAPSTQPMHSHA